jgi:hypothetical protein
MPQQLITMAIIALCLNACAARHIDTLQTLPLAPGKILPQPGQVLQQMEVSYDQQNMTLTAVLAESDDDTSIVLLDPLGKRLLSITRQGETISHYRDPTMPNGLPVHFLLAASYVAWFHPKQWQALETSPWSLTVGCNHRFLSHRGKPIVTVTFVSPTIKVCSENFDITEVGMRLSLKHHRQPLSIALTTEQWQPL